MGKQEKTGENKEKYWKTGEFNRKKGRNRK